MRRDRQLLVDHGHAGPARLQRVARRVGLAVQRHGAGVGGEGAGQDGHQRALARAVLPDEGDDLAGRDAEVDAVEGDGGGEGLGDAAHLQRGRAAAAQGFQPRRPVGREDVLHAGGIHGTASGNHDLARPCGGTSIDGYTGRILLWTHPSGPLSAAARNQERITRPLARDVFVRALPDEPSNNALTRDPSTGPDRDVIPTRASEVPLPPALLTMANYTGTLAAVRALGRAGIPVTTADPSRLAVSAWSKYATVRVRCSRGPGPCAFPRMAHLVRPKARPARAAADQRRHRVAVCAAPRRAVALLPPLLASGRRGLPSPRTSGCCTRKPSKPVSTCRARGFPRRRRISSSAAAKRTSR